MGISGKPFLPTLLVLLAVMVSATLFAGEPMDEKAFMERIVGSTEEEVSGMLGEPKMIQENADYTSWVYTSAVKDLLTGHVFPVTQLLFVDGRVTDVINARQMPEEEPSDAQ